MWEETPPLDDLAQSLSDPSRPIGQRMRAAYYLKQIYLDAAGSVVTNDGPADQGGDQDELVRVRRREEVVDALVAGLSETGHGSLLRHEVAYVMGQLRDVRCRPVLESVLLDCGDCPMVRHEAAEALGAIGSPLSQSVLSLVAEGSSSGSVSVPPPEVVETCRLALAVMEWRESGGDPDAAPPACPCMLYPTVDPAPAHPAHNNLPASDLGNILLNPGVDMFERYRAMFSLRDKGGDDAVEQLCRALLEDQSSALLRHEVAYVLGQMRPGAAVEALEASLRNVHENMMVRHESAEALGAIDERWDDVEPILREFAFDGDQVVRESCLVALDAGDYWGHGVKGDKGQNEEEVATASFADQKAADRRLLVGDSLLD